MLAIRKNIFETNSSSTHSLSISNYDNIENHINALSNIIYDLDGKEDLYEALYHVKEIEAEIKEGIRELEDYI